MSAPKRPEHLRWLVANKHDLAFLTGTDFKALAAVAALVELYAYTGHLSALRAAGVAVAEMQASARPLARELIAFVMDWGDRERLWPHVERGIAEAMLARPAPAFPEVTP